ncbi:hypothetical protein EBB07_31080 [Paenibacillaceae bacterium]|nr:hypothetical protein EBB07_31080 [Paenibacillaceae bacterium]
MKIVIEGPSAVGKSTLCRKLVGKYNAIVIDEIIVEPIRGYTPYEEAVFYLDKEISRWNTIVKTDKLTILDTDPQKSIWFNWSLGFKNCLSLQELDAYFRDKVRMQKIGFADLYVVLIASRKELMNRKNGDLFRERDNFDWISKANEYRERYYQYLYNVIPNHVVFIESTDLDTTFANACKTIDSATPVQYKEMEIYSKLIEWVGKNS